MERLKEENKKLQEANLTRAGEASILRADVQNLKNTIERREVESSQQLNMLKKQVQQMNADHQKQIESSKTEMKFKVCCLLIAFALFLLFVHLNVYF